MMFALVTACVSLFECQHGYFQIKHVTEDQCTRVGEKVLDGKKLILADGRVTTWTFDGCATGERAPKDMKNLGVVGK